MTAAAGGSSLVLFSSSCCGAAVMAGVAVGITTISGAGYTCGVPVGGSVAALSGVEEPPGVGAGVGVAVSGVAVGAVSGVEVSGVALSPVAVSPVAVSAVAAWLKGSSPLKNRRISPSTGMSSSVSTKLVRGV